MNLDDLTVGMAVKVVRGMEVRHRTYTFTVRAVANGEVRVDNGDPANSNLLTNGMTIAAWLSPRDVRPWVGAWRHPPTVDP